MGTPLPTSGAILRMEKMTNNAYSGHSINDPPKPHHFKDHKSRNYFYSWGSRYYFVLVELYRGESVYQWKTELFRGDSSRFFAFDSMGAASQL